ncbi:kinase-like domain-containing protein [Mycena filopes]|nr:kinase-like domain-containing protein [Mycena filopes]
MTARGSEAQRLLNLFQDLLDLDSFSVIKPLIFKTLAALSHASGLHPQCFPIPGLQKLGHQVAGGGFGDIWKGLVNGQSVSVKIMRIFQERTIEAASKEFGREALIWRQLSHPNLLPFYGLYYFEDRLCLVSPWMEHGNILEFLRKDPPNINRVSLILDVALGLQYLHQENVIHGDLKAINILVTPSRRACICDFGLSSIVNDITLRLIHSTTNAQQGTARYLAPELLRSNGKKHFLSDVYAFACVSYEILTGNVPFHTEKNDMVVMLQVLEGVRPTQPAACSGTRQLNSVWKLLESCWEADPQMRPTAGQIVERLVDPLVGAKTTTSTTDWDDQSTCKFRRSLQDWPLLPSVNQIECRLFGNEAAQACRQCFPAREMFPRSSRKNLKDIVPKRQYMGDTSDSREDNLRPETKRSRTSMSDFKSQRGTKRRMGTSYYQNPYKFSEQQSTPRF